ncbi:Thiamin-binding periplasmic protein [Halorhabdus tiamatea SARL4B]|uniref:Thiamin-binding periplasmic protein n=1 Tax=Halorhabdus tiamatea SARL4B TaxID=1033806 RepID=U2DF48_9EURY|nr:thiamine ABC transporter substrate-binding protein [Halorhabdus tiamatea]ERJ04722.1 Thiamin-binding periplasmic protein [Halorhabdus tiamatea SARL4B]
MKRRAFLRTAGASVVGATALAGCAGEESTDTTPSSSGGFAGTLRVATYSSFTGEGAAGNWLKSVFEAAHPEVTVEFMTPENGLNQYILRQQNGADIDADLYVGLNTAELVRADQEIETPLFESVESDLERAGTVKSGLQIDPDGRAIPYDTGYISLVYDEGEVENPGTFDALTSDAYQGDLIAQNAQQSDPGRAFLLWTIAEKGPDNYLEYWQDLLENDVTILSDWEPAYDAYMNEEAPMVVSYSTDQVFYHGDDVDIQKHQVGFLNDQGYANPEAMALFADADSPDLGRAFMDFVLSSEAQAEIAVRNVQFPAVEGVDPGEEFSQYAYEPPEPVTFAYDELAGNVDGWIEDWAREIAN